MGRSSRHESSHRVRSRDERERSDSEEEQTLRERKSREASVPADSGKRKSSSLGKTGAVNGDCNRSKKRDRRGGSVSSADRDSADEIELKAEERAKVSTADSKIRVSKRREGSGDGKSESKRKSEKEYSRRESSNHHKDGKERDEEVRERDSGRSRDSKAEKEKDKKNQVSRRERSRDTSGRKRGAANSVDDDYAAKRDVENDDWQTEDEPHNIELEKDSDKHDAKRLDNYPESKDGESQRSRTKSGAYKDEKHRDGSSRGDKYRDEGSHREHRREEKSKEDSSRDRSGGRSHSKHYRDDRKTDKRNRHHDSDYDGSPYRESSKGRKRHSDEGDGPLDSKSRSSKEPRSNLERSASNKAFLDAAESHPKTSPSRPGEGSSLSEERQAFRSSKEKQVKESTPLNERTPSSASEPGIGSSPFTRTENFSPAVRFGVDTQGLSSMEDDGSFKGGARYKRAPDMGNIRATSWKGVNAWPAPGVNGFIPFQHIPPPHGYLNQFPPSLFGVRPGVPFHHLHEPRPYIWPNPSDNWDDDPHVYGRLPVTWEMKTQTQTQTQAVDVVPVKESEPLTTNDQAMSPVESEETRESQERIHVAASKNEVNTSFCTVYLSRLDISPYLAGSELHKQCVDLVGVADMAQTNPRFCRSRLKDIGGESVWPISLSSSFPALPGTAFERSMSLYKNQTQDWKAMAGHLIHDEEKNKSDEPPVSLDNQLVIPTEENDESSARAAPTTAADDTQIIIPKEDQSSVIPKEDQSSVIPKEDQSSVITKEEQMPGCAAAADIPLFDGMEETERTIGGASVENCEKSIMEEASSRNVSRIHGSSQSTH